MTTRPQFIHRYKSRPGSPLSMPLAWKIFIVDTGNLLTGVSGSLGVSGATADGVLEEAVICVTVNAGGGATA